MCCQKQMWDVALSTETIPSIIEQKIQQIVHLNERWFWNATRTRVFWISGLWSNFKIYQDKRQCKICGKQPRGGEWSQAGDFFTCIRQPHYHLHTLLSTSGIQFLDRGNKFMFLHFSVWIALTICRKVKCTHCLATLHPGWFRKRERCVHTICGHWAHPHAHPCTRQLACPGVTQFFSVWSALLLSTNSITTYFKCFHMRLYCAH